MTHVVYPRGSPALRTFGPAASMHGYARRKQWRVSCVVGACWAAGQIGKRPTQVNGCPQRIGDRSPIVERCPMVFNTGRALLSRRGVPAGQREGT
jgi:hypothetical protein